ncbi:MAG: hypothetical protein FWD74_06275 [Actinomycetia bacterium]|nr:hypothetical protein [Actinomycetes bacterium]
MPDVLIRGLSSGAIERIDAQAATAGLSRNEYLRRQLDRETDSPGAVSVNDLKRASEAASDLLDPDVMGAAWR